MSYIVGVCCSKYDLVTDSNATKVLSTEEKSGGKKSIRKAHDNLNKYNVVYDNRFDGLKKYNDKRHGSSNI